MKFCHGDIGLYHVKVRLCFTSIMKALFNAHGDLEFENVLAITVIMPCTLIRILIKLSFVLLFLLFQAFGI